MSKYVRLCQTLNTKGELVQFSDNKDIEKRTERSPSSDWYMSLFRYGEEAFKYFEEHGSIGGFSGEASLNELVFDLDSKDPEIARQDAIELLKLLKNQNVDVRKNTKIYFSGNKGFHVHVALNKFLKNSEIQNICANICENINTFDPKVYNTTRLFRIPNTLHQKSGLYKIPLTPDELYKLSITQIQELAKDKRELVQEFLPVSDESFLEKFNNEVKHKPVVVHINDNGDGIRGLDNIDFSTCPKHTPRCVFALSRGVMQSGKGHRSEIFLRLAAYYANNGLDKDNVYNLLKSVSRQNHVLYPEYEQFPKEEIWNTIIQSTFNSDTWKTKPGTSGIDPNNEVIKHYCDAVGRYTDTPCCLHHKHNKPDTIMTISGIEDSFNSFATNFDKNIVKTGIRLIDDYMKIAVGTTTLIAGACGSGKTSLCLNIMENANAENQHTMFFSLDMHKNLVYLKLAQKVTSYSQDQILNFYKVKDSAKIEEIKKLINKKYGKTFFDFSSTLSIEDMRDKVLAAEERNKCKIRLVVVDYASRVSGQYSDVYANARYNALKSTEVASDTNAAWIWLNQVSRNSGDGSTPLRSKRVAKDSGDWEESATNVITCWRPFMGQEDSDDIMRLYLAKNRMGKEVERPLYWDGAKGKVWDMSEQEYINYKEERESLEKDKQKKTGFS